MEWKEVAAFHQIANGITVDPGKTRKPCGIRQWGCDGHERKAERVRDGHVDIYEAASNADVDDEKDAAVTDIFGDCGKNELKSLRSLM